MNIEIETAQFTEWNPGKWIRWDLIASRLWPIQNLRQSGVRLITRITTRRKTHTLLRTFSPKIVRSRQGLSEMKWSYCAIEYKLTSNALGVKLNPPQGDAFSTMYKSLRTNHFPQVHLPRIQTAKRERISYLHLWHHLGTYHVNQKQINP